VTARSKGRYGLALFWLLAGSLHFLRPRLYEKIVPPALARHKRQVVVASGVAELAGGLAVLADSTRRIGRWWLLATLVAVYPANIHMAVRSERFPRIPTPLLWARLPVQALFAWFTWRGTE
jgi:uncharacterized membrane protein